MLPAPKTRRFSLADVMPSMLDSVLGRPNTLQLQPVDKTVVILVDGLGAEALTARAGHARNLAPRLNRSSTISSGFPTTTASAIATATTGTTPGEHGLVGYSVLDPANHRVVNQLSGWDDDLDPWTWQRMPTVFERGADAGIPSFVVGTERFRTSGFTKAVLRGATYRSGASITDRMTVARDILDANDRTLVYLYIAELDKAGHADGSESEAWTQVLEEIDSAVGAFATGMRRGEGLLVTADHGVLDVPEHRQVLFDADPAVIDGIRFVAGEPRCLQLHFEPDAGAALRDRVVDRWRTNEGTRSWVATRDEAIEAGWFGADVALEVVPRIGDLIVAARKGIAYYDSRVTVRSGRSMIGQHGSLSSAETDIPLLRFGDYAGE